MQELVVFWTWITPIVLSLVTETSVYHWYTEGDSEPVKMFDRDPNHASNQIVNYLCDPTEKWLVLIGTARGSREMPRLCKGWMQLYSVDDGHSKTFEGHAASFARLMVTGDENPSVLCFVTKTITNGAITSKLHVQKLVGQLGNSEVSEKIAPVLFPLHFDDDYAISVQVSRTYDLIHVLTKGGLLFVHDLRTAVSVYMAIISPAPIFLTAKASVGGGFYAINTQGQVILTTINEDAVVPYVLDQLRDRYLASHLANRGCFPGAQDLISQQFQKLSGQDTSMFVSSAQDYDGIYSLLRTNVEEEAAVPYEESGDIHGLEELMRFEVNMEDLRNKVQLAESLLEPCYSKLKDGGPDLSVPARKITCLKHLICSQKQELKESSETRDKMILDLLEQRRLIVETREAAERLVKLSLENGWVGCALLPARIPA